MARTPDARNSHRLHNATEPQVRLGGMRLGSWLGKALNPSLIPLKKLLFARNFQEDERLAMVAAVASLPAQPRVADPNGLTVAIFGCGRMCAPPPPLRACRPVHLPHFQKWWHATRLLSLSSACVPTGLALAQGV